jgi:hypothetical protein
MHNVLVIADRHVTIVNYLDGNLDLTIHCKSRDNDLGVHVLRRGDSFSWAFKDNIINTTLFYCSFQWSGETHWFDIYKSKRDSDTCPDGYTCKWLIQQTGPCVNSIFCYDWNK